ncbi:MAG: DUF5675 family protein [Pseudomonadota bacterium]
MARSVYPDPNSRAYVSFSTSSVPLAPVAKSKVMGANETIPGNRTVIEFQGYLDRVRNYIPIEILAFFVFVNSLVGKTHTTTGEINANGYVAVAAVVLGAIATILYVRATARAEENPFWKLQATLALLAFFIWVYAIDAKALGIFKLEVIPSLSGLLLASFTVFSGLIIPGSSTRVPATIKLRYQRLEGTVNDGKANGKVGLIEINSKSFHSIERMDGYKWLRPGSYECEFGVWTSSSGKKSQAIRVLGDYSKGRIYIHPANKPSQLAGCIAPGVTKTDIGVGRSKEALLEIFRECGGYVEGKKITLKVEGVMPEFEPNVVEIEPGDAREAYVEDVSDELLIF